MLKKVLIFIKYWQKKVEIGKKSKFFGKKIFHQNLMSGYLIDYFILILDKIKIFIYEFKIQSKSLV